MNLKSQLEKAIVTGDWSIVAELYEYLFEGSQAPKPPENTNTDESDMIDLLDSIIAYCHNTKSNLQQQDIEFDYVEEDMPNNTNNDKNIIDISELEETVQRTQPKVKFVTDDGHDSTTAINESSKGRNRSKRPEYKSKIVKCTRCGSEFDYNKEYGVVMTERKNLVKCNKCRIKAG